MTAYDYRNAAPFNTLSHAEPIDPRDFRALRNDYLALRDRVAYLEDLMQLILKKGPAFAEHLPPKST